MRSLPIKNWDLISAVPNIVVVPVLHAYGVSAGSQYVNPYGVIGAEIPHGVAAIGRTANVRYPVPAEATLIQAQSPDFIRDGGITYLTALVGEYIV